ncbi:MAG TPA: glycosyltransferase family 39 protein [Aquihabitans sp.]|nr:glycosyltransferase family 39 protein [Aquihabitans sp.]
MTLVAPPREEAREPGPAGASSPAAEASADGGTPWWAAALLVVAVLAGVVARFTARSALWLDEAISVDIARLPLDQIAGALREDGHPPVYYYLLHVWTGWFGTSSTAVRSLSGVVAVAALPLAWALGRRLGGRRTAALATVLLATSPFAVRYATEARMYSLMTFLCLAGLLAVHRALEAPRLGRLLPVAVVAAATPLTHYWGMWVLAAAVIALAVAGWRHPAVRGAALRVGAAIAAGALAFVPWLPTVAYQAQHTGTPWARSVEPFDAAFDSLLDFGGGKWPGGRLLGLVLGLLVVLALVAVPVERWRLAVDLRTVPGARAELGFGSLTVLLGLGAAVATSSAFQPRYAAPVLGPVLLAAAVGIDRLPDRALRAAVVTVVALVGLAGAVRWEGEPRTQAAEVAGALADEGRAGDVVAYCPDQLRPAVQRIIDREGPDGLRSTTYPSGSPPGRVDWVDYRQRIRAADPAATARELLDRAGPGTVWVVSAPDYRGFGTDCEDLRAELARARGRSAAVVDRDGDAYEKALLHRYPPR